ncbi:MAG: hypothetical protein ACYS83_07830, partial [Planctomycetota bacterium]
MKARRVTRDVIAILAACVGLSLFAAEVCAGNKTKGNEVGAAAGCAKSSSSNFNWFQFRGPNRNGKSAETGLLKKWPEGGPELLWSVEDKLGIGFSSVTVVDGLIYTTGMVDNRGILFAFDLNGKDVWERDYGPEWTGARKGTRTTPTFDDGRLYVISGYA